MMIRSRAGFCGRAKENGCECGCSVLYFRMDSLIEKHADIVWIQHDGTEAGIVDDLSAAGIPKDQIVLAFYSPRRRVHTELAVS